MEMKNDTKIKRDGPDTEIINDTAFHASQVLIESINLDSSSAENVGFAIADRMMRNWGGQSIYFPKDLRTSIGA